MQIKGDCLCLYQLSSSSDIFRQIAKWDYIEVDQSFAQVLSLKWGENLWEGGDVSNENISEWTGCLRTGGDIFDNIWLYPR